MAEISFSRENLINRTPSYITHDNSDEIISIDLSLDGSLVLTGALDDTANAYLVTSGCKEFNYVDKPYGINNLKFTSNNDLIYSNRKGSVGIIKKIFSTVFASFILIVKIFGEEASYARIWAFEWF